MSSGGGKVSIPNSVKKMIQNIKEIAGNHSEEEIYVMLKECNMDPNETAQKLLFQGVFCFLWHSFLWFSWSLCLDDAVCWSVLAFGDLGLFGMLIVCYVELGFLYRLSFVGFWRWPFMCFNNPGLFEWMVRSFEIICLHLGLLI